MGRTSQMRSPLAPPVAFAPPPAAALAASAAALELRDGAKAPGSLLGFLANSLSIAAISAGLTSLRIMSPRGAPRNLRRRSGTGSWMTLSLMACDH